MVRLGFKTASCSGRTQRISHPSSLRHIVVLMYIVFGAAITVPTRIKREIGRHFHGASTMFAAPSQYVPDCPVLWPNSTSASKSQCEWTYLEDLAQKTRRGIEGRVLAGKNGGAAPRASYIRPRLARQSGSRPAHCGPARAPP